MRCIPFFLSSYLLIGLFFPFLSTLGLEPRTSHNSVLLLYHVGPSLKGKYEMQFLSNMSSIFKAKESCASGITCKLHIEKVCSCELGLPPYNLGKNRFFVNKKGLGILDDAYPWLNYLLLFTRPYVASFTT